MNTSKVMSRNELLTACERSMRYHHERVRFCNLAHQIIQFIVFAFSAGTATSLLFMQIFGEMAVFAFLMVSLLALASLVWNPSEKASVHRLLHRDFTRLAGNIASTAKPGDALLAEWTREIHDLFAKEPPVYHALDAHCYNQLSIKLDVVNQGYFVDLGWHHRLLRNWLHFHGTTFPIRNQVQQ